MLSLQPVCYELFLAVSQTMLEMRKAWRRRVEPNCDVLDKLSGPQARRSIIQTESRGGPLLADISRLLLLTREELRVAMHLVGKWARKRPNRRYGAGRRCKQGSYGPFSPIASSKSPGRKNHLAASSALISSAPAPYRRSARFWAEKTTTCRREIKKGHEIPDAQS